MTDWHGKPYYSLDAYCKNTFHHKCYKIALNAHMTCPNRDGHLDTRGCIFCSAGGSGEFAAELPICTEGQNASLDITAQLESGLSLFGDKKVGEHFIAYLQAYTNTYAPTDYLEQVYRSAVSHPMVAGLSIATRPDCLGLPVLELLRRIKEDYPGKFLWVELGLQTIHEETARYLRRGYELSVFEKGFRALSSIGIPVIVHVILGLPGETEAMQLETIEYLSRLKPFGVKLQLLHVLRGTDLEQEYLAGHFQVMTKDAYLSLLAKAISRLDPDIVIHRVTGDGRGSDLIAPDWSRNKKDVLNNLHHLLSIKKIRQGCAYAGSGELLSSPQGNLEKR